jgi:hypothetical protein
MDVPIVKVKPNRYGKLKAKIILDYDSDSLSSGDYALVKIESINDRIQVGEFIEQLKNK